MSDIASVTDPAGLSDSPESDIHEGNLVLSCPILENRTFRVGARTV